MPGLEPRVLCCLQTTYPFNEEFVNGIILQDSQQHTSDAIPRVELLREIVGAEGSNPGSKRLHLQLNLQDQPLFGAVNLTGPILDWSFPEFQNIPPQVRPTYGTSISDKAFETLD